ncbi:MAG TPA: hypothetical protein VK184_22180 [Nostocaceae cyanobacterium]|nr:hypothetical protein [Nostocaceae cyanobacterium]
MTKIKESAEAKLPSEEIERIEERWIIRKNKRKRRSLEKFMGVNIPKLYNTVAGVNNENLRITQNRLNELLTIEEDEEEAIVKPSEYAFNTACKIISDVYRVLQDKFPKASVSVDSVGKITLRWNRPEKKFKVGFVCSDNQEEDNYIYYKKGEEFELIENATSQTLIQWLELLNNA